MKYLKDFCPPLRHGVRLLVGTDEECGSQDLSSYRQRESLPPIIFTPDAGYPVINTEKGRAVASFLKTLRPSAPGKMVESASGGGAVNAVPDRAEALVSGFSAEELYAAAARSPSGIRYDFTPEGGGRYRILAAGKSAHASAPSTGENAVTGLIALLSLLEPDWEEIAALFPHGETDGTSLGISCADSVSGALTASFDVLSYRAPDFTGTFDIRFPLGQTGGTLLQLLRKTLDARRLCAEGIPRVRAAPYPARFSAGPHAALRLRRSLRQAGKSTCNRRRHLCARDSGGRRLRPGGAWRRQSYACRR